MSFFKFNDLKVGDLITPYNVYFDHKVQVTTYNQRRFYLQQYTMAFQGKITRHTDVLVGHEGHNIYSEPSSYIAIILSYDNVDDKMKVYCCEQICFLHDAFGIEYKKL
jgi:hypothetical protein